MLCLFSQFLSDITIFSFFRTEDGLNLAKKVKAAKFVECSALTRSNLDLVFSSAIESYFKPAKGKKLKNGEHKTCQII